MSDFPYQITRTVLIGARPETVFRFFTDSERWARWWGPGSTIEPWPDGHVYIRHSNGVETVGTVVEILDGRRLVFTYGFPGGKPIPIDGSQVTIRLDTDAAGTRLHLLHEFKEEVSAADHIQAWRFQLSVFSNVVAAEVHAGCEQTIDDWFAAWTIADAETRLGTLGRLASPGIRYRDRFSLLEGIEDVSAHLAAYQRFVPGLVYRRKGDCRQCQGSVLVAWAATGADGNQRMSGTAVFTLDVDGKILAVTSFIDPS